MKIGILYTALIFSAFLYLSSCKEENIPLADIIRFANADEETLAADNTTTLKITAIIPPDASSENRSIQFTTDLGEFSNDTNSITQTANSSGEATVYFHSSQIGKATIKATVSTFSITKTVSCMQADLSGLIRFDSFSIDPITADNITTRTVTVQIDKNTPQDKRQVTLTTDLGTFTNQQATITLLAGADGSVNTSIKSDAPGTANITAACNGFSVSTALKFIAPDPNTIVKFDDGLATSVPADGVSELELRAVINNNTLPASRAVSFATDNGTFSNGQTSQSVTPNESGIAATSIKSAAEGTALVSITHRNVTRTRTFTFTRAYPDDMTISTDFVLTTGAANKITIHTQLLRTVGKSSPNFQIEYSAFLDNGATSVGQFNNNVATNSDGQGTVDFSALGASPGVITIYAKVKEKPSVNAMVRVTVVN